MTVEVTAELDQLLPRFADPAELEEYLIDDALERYAQLFGQSAWGGPWIDWDFLTPGGTRDGDGGPESDRNHSETNVQVAGVDEGDIIEVDADHIYLVTQDSLVIADAWPAEQLHVASRVALPGTPLVEYLRDDRLTVISDTSVWIDDKDGGGDPGGGDVAGGVVPEGIRDGFDIFPPRGRWLPSVTVTVLDVTDRTAPAIVQETQFEGRYVDSRSVNGFVYLVLQQPFMLPPPQTICSDDGGDDGSGEGDGGGDDGPIPLQTDCVYQTEEEYLEWVRANIGELIAEVLPEYTSYDADHQFVRGGLLTEAADIFRPSDSDRGNLLVVTGIDMTNSEPGPVSSAAIPSSPTAHIYASRENLYVFDDGAAAVFFGSLATTGQTATDILKFAWNADNGHIDFVGTGEVPGSLHNQFSVDQYDGQLRIATTSSNFEPGEAWARSTNELFVLTDNGGVIEGLGSLQGLASQETIRSVRFLGDRAYAVTFRNIDPLFALDLSDPTNPRDGRVEVPWLLELSAVCRRPLSAGAWPQHARRLEWATAADFVRRRRWWPAGCCRPVYVGALVSDRGGRGPSCVRVFRRARCIGHSGG